MKRILMSSRTYGWVQNPSDFSKLKLVVQIFDSSSDHYKRLRDHLIIDSIPFKKLQLAFLEKLTANVEEFTYSELVGHSRDITGSPAKNRKEAVADSLIQVTILPQSTTTTGKTWTDNWTADGFLRWALSLNFVSHDREEDLCSITTQGLYYARTEDDSDEELDILRDALLRYPPATQVMRILRSAKIPVSKFYIGNRLGFQGEKGFTSYNEKIMTDWFRTGSVAEQKKIKSDIEGTSDKYARMISSWLNKVGFVVVTRQKLDTTQGEKVGFPIYSLSGRGLHALNQSEGGSKNRCVEKFITWEFLAVEGKNRDYIRTRRALILKNLEVTKSFQVLLDELKKAGFNEDPVIIENDIKGLNNIGICIKKSGNRIVLVDKLVDFTIPKLNLTNELKDAYTEQQKARFLKETDLDIRFIELLEIAYDGNRNRDFELITAELFVEAYNLCSVTLGGGLKPDLIAFTDQFGIIVDTKAYTAGYTKSIQQEDAMVRYIEDNQLRDPSRNATVWWENFDSDIPPRCFYYLWVSSKFVGQFEDQLQSTFKRTGTKGAALNVEQLLLGADSIMKGRFDKSDIPKYMNNKEIIWSMQEECQ